MSKDLGMALKLLRKNHGFTQQQIADILNMSRSNYAYYEGGSTEPGLKDIMMLAKIFNVDVELLLPDTDGAVGISLRDVTATEPEDVPVEDTEKLNPRSESLLNLTKDEKSLLLRYRILNDEQRAELKAAVDKMLDQD